MENIKGVFAYKIDNKIFFRADSQTIEGMYKAYGPYFVQEINTDQIDLGQQILRTFEECKIGLPHPKNLTKLSVLEKEDPYSESEEAKLLKKLKKAHKDLRLSILFDGKNYLFHPYKVINKNYSEGINCEPLISDGDPIHLGKTLLKAFDLCE